MYKRPARAAIALIAFLAACSSSPSPAAAPPPPAGQPVQTTSAEAPGEWPRERIAEDGSLVIAHQPQLESWEGHNVLRARLAVSIASAEGGDPMIGALFVEGRTETDFGERKVFLYDTTIVDMNFPSVPEAEQAALRARLQALIPTMSREIELDRILVALDRGDHGVREVAASLEPPQIFVSMTPAILILMDGEPAFARLAEDAEPGFAVNTNWDLFEVGDTYALRDDRNWLVADDWRGPWSLADGAPVDVRRLPTDENWKEMHEAIGAGPDPDYVVPRVFVATEPAEMIVVEGAPEFVPIAGTSVQSVTNTASDLFVHDGAYYYAVSGRWFRAGTLDGAWEAATLDLPADFASLPDDDEFGHFARNDRWHARGRGGGDRRGDPAESGRGSEHSAGGGCLRR